MEKDKETKKELEEQVEELKKSNKIMKGLLIARSSLTTRSSA